MRLKLSKKWIDYLLKMPETGMGYQIVNIKLKDGRLIENVFAFNSEEIDLPEKYDGIKEEDIEEIKIAKKL